MSSDQKYLFLLMIAFIVKHFACDFLLQNEWMATGKRQSLPKSIKPLGAHSLIHALTTGLITLVALPGEFRTAFFLTLLDFMIHGLMDFVKANPRLWGRYSHEHGHIYYAVFGFDQMIHHLTNVLIIYLISTHK